MALIIAAFCVASGAAAGVALRLPNGEGYITVPFRNLLPAAIAITAITYCAAPPAQAFPLATPRLAAVRRMTLATVVTGSAVLLGITTAAASHNFEQATVGVRSTLAWSALAVIAVTVMGRTYAAALPIASIVLLLFTGFNPDHTPRWFNWSADNASQLGTWLCVTVLIAGAAASTLLTPWQRYAARRMRVLAKENSHC